MQPARRLLRPDSVNQLGTTVTEEPEQIFRAPLPGGIHLRNWWDAVHGLLWPDSVNQQGTTVMEEPEQICRASLPGEIHLRNWWDSVRRLLRPDSVNQLGTTVTEELEQTFRASLPGEIHLRNWWDAVHGLLRLDSVNQLGTTVTEELEHIFRAFVPGGIHLMRNWWDAVHWLLRPESVNQLGPSVTEELEQIFRASLPGGIHLRNWWDAVHRLLRPDSVTQLGTTVTEEPEQIFRASLPGGIHLRNWRAVVHRLNHHICRTQSSVARSYRNRKQLLIIIMFLSATFSGFVQIQYQSKTKSLSDEHGAFMAATLVNLGLYGLSFIAEFQLRIEEPYLDIIKTFGPLLGFLALVLLLFILVPWLGVIASIIWALFLIKAAITSFPMIAQCLRWVFSPVTSYLASEPSHYQQALVQLHGSLVQSRAQLNP